MKKLKLYRKTRFAAEVIESASSALRGMAQALPDSGKERLYLRVTVDDSQWSHDDEAEFFADYRRAGAHSSFSLERGPYSLALLSLTDSVEVSVGAPKRGEIENIFAVFERNLAASLLPDSTAAEGDAEAEAAQDVTVFIGHGHSREWKALKDHLHEQHGYTVVAYEIGARAGHTIRDALEDMLEGSSFALLVMTGEDQLSDGRIHPRLNVVHEAGLFQGRLGFHRAIVLLEEGTEEFSNIEGLQQLRFSKGNVREAFGDVLAVLRREFE